MLGKQDDLFYIELKIKNEYLSVFFLPLLLVQDTFILVFVPIMSLVEETSGQNLRDFLQPKHQLQTNLN